MLINEKNLKFLPLYKTIFFRFVKFETNSKDEQMVIITNALNIKRRRKRITYVYDATCDFIDTFYQGKNICGFKNCECYVQRARKEGLKNGCCRNCIYQTSNGCPSKNLACKLFNCSEVYSRCKVIEYKDLKTVKIFSIRQRVIVASDYFSLREDVLKDLYSYSLIYAGLRMTFRIVKNYIILKLNNRRKNVVKKAD